MIVSIRSAVLAAFGLFIATATANAAVFIETFESGTVGNDVETIGWTNDVPASSTDFTIELDPADATNKVLRSRGPADQGFTTYVGLSSPIPASSTAATLYFRIRFDGNADTDRTFAGLTDQAAPQIDSFSDKNAYLGGITGGGSWGVSQSGGTQTVGTTPDNDAWYNAWLVINSATETYDVYVKQADTAATAADLLIADAPFRVSAGDLQTLAVFSTGAQETNGSVYFDNFALDLAGENLEFQLGIPEPTTAALLGLGAIALMRRRRCAKA